MIYCNIYRYTDPLLWNLTAWSPKASYLHSEIDDDNSSCQHKILKHKLQAKKTWLLLLVIQV